MKRVQVESFVSVVREFLDEVNANDSEFLKGDDSSSLDAIIKSKIKLARISGILAGSLISILFL